MLNKKIILAVIQVSFDYQRRILRGMRRFALQRPEWEVHLCSYDGHMSERIGSYFKPAGIIGYFRKGDSFGEDLELARRLSGNRVVGVSGWETHLSLPRVVSDDERIAASASDFFLSRGFRNFLFAGDTGKPPHGASVERGKAFREILRKAGHSVKEATPDEVFSASFHLDLPCAAFAFNDITARRLVDALAKRGYAVPEDVAVLGVDNDPFEGELSAVPLSSIITDAEGVGYEAARILDQMLSGVEVADGVVKRIPPLRIAERTSTDMFAAENPFLRKALHLIRSEITQIRTVAEIASLAGTSRRVLEKGFRKHLGRSVYELMQEARVNYAKRLLLETDLSITEASYTAGFSDPRMLSVIFRRLTGETPSGFRKRNQPDLASARLRG
ncbi:MAG: substrate-binding domain-containing protein [Opitutales bacterium]|nr:substrate-binding domain-containing protein [Opitutales bacterium]